MPRGRPVQSAIRQNIVEILAVIEKGYGYGICKTYLSIFPAVTMRSIYYHLAKGVETEEFKIAEVKKEEGEFSWGNTVTKIYYALGPRAKPLGREEVKRHFAASS